MIDKNDVSAEMAAYWQGQMRLKAERDAYLMALKMICEACR